eukprot:scaffold5017_cov171-Amphora_coffeaeformis.AAC.6
METAAKQQHMSENTRKHIVSIYCRGAVPVRVTTEVHYGTCHSRDAVQRAAPDMVRGIAWKGCFARSRSVVQGSTKYRDRRTNHTIAGKKIMRSISGRDRPKNHRPNTTGLFASVPASRRSTQGKYNNKKSKIDKEPSRTGYTIKGELEIS